MKKTLQILIGLLLILLLSYLAFLDISAERKNDLFLSDKIQRKETSHTQPTIDNNRNNLKSEIKIALPDIEKIIIEKNTTEPIVKIVEKPLIKREIIQKPLKVKYSTFKKASVIPSSSNSNKIYISIPSVVMVPEVIEIVTVPIPIKTVDVPKAPQNPESKKENLKIKELNE